MFSCEYCKISNNTCFEEHLHTAASENNNKKRFLGKDTSYNDHYMINMDRQGPKIGSNWPLTSPYLQHCSSNLSGLIIVVINTSLVTNDTQDLMNIHPSRNSHRDTFPCMTALKLPLYFYLLMEKPLGYYFQVWSPYYRNTYSCILKVTDQVCESQKG